MRSAVAVLAACALPAGVLTGCATPAKPPPRACLAFGQSDSIHDAMPGLYGDLSKGRYVVVSRAPDGRGGLVVNLDVWTKFDPEAPTPPQAKARFVLDACTLEVRSASKLTG